VRRCVDLMHEPVLLGRISKRSLLIFSCSRHKTSQFTELTVWPARANYSWTIYLMSKKIMNMPLTLLFSRLAFSVSMSLDVVCTAHAFSPNARLITAVVSVALFLRFIGPDTQLKIGGRKNQ
jgi:hypothetical protein